MRSQISSRLSSAELQVRMHCFGAQLVVQKSNRVGALLLTVGTIGTAGTNPMLERLELA
jgi:hypothetical protein